MPESKKYTTISVTEGIKADLVAQQEGTDTYSSVIRRALNEQELSRDEVKSRLDRMQKQINRQTRLQVRMAVEMGLERDQIPKQMAGQEARGGDDIFTPPEEETTDLYAEEKAAKMQAREEVLNLERGDDGFLRPEGQDQAPHGFTHDQEEEINERAAEILAESASGEEAEEGGTLPWESDNNEGEN